DEIIKAYEKMQFEERILPLLPPPIREEVVYFIEDEFSNRIKEGEKVRKGISGDEMMSHYNEDRFSPIDGELIRACDKLAAFIEASLSIRHGIVSHHLEEGKELIYEKYKDERPCGIDFRKLFDYFK
ncbi:MAG: HD domain-containing protein, partial [Syntrophobacteraceae bacterium]